MDLNELDFDSMTRDEILEVLKTLDGLNDKELLDFVVRDLGYAALSDEAVKFLARLQVAKERVATMHAQVATLKRKYS
jgi:hypothetical protein